MSAQTFDANSGSRVWWISVIVCVFVTGLGWFFWMRGQSILQGDLRDRLQSTASIAASLIDAEDIEEIHSPEDMDSPEFQMLVKALKNIRASASHIHFAYILRRTDDPNLLEFVVDADALGTTKELDLNRNGIVDAGEEGSNPGDLYDISKMPTLQNEAFVRASVDRNFTADQWGILLSGYAPIRNDRGDAIAVLGIDMSAEEYIARSQRIFSPFALLFVILSGLGIAGLIQWESVKRQLSSNAFLAAERSGLLQLTLHRLGTPLTIFKWSLESLADCTQNNICSPEDVETHIRQMRSGIQSMDGIIKQLLEVERIERKDMHNEPKAILVCPIVEEIVKELSIELSARKQSIAVTSCTHAAAKVDPDILREILRELLHNAVMYSPKGGKITIDSMKSKNHIIIVIADNGCGVPAGEEHRIFEKFSRGSNAHLCDPNGAGLGLYIAAPAEKSG
jgi:signal transduction histidine kinase